MAFEACATAHYWARVTLRHGHQIKIIPAQAIVPFRQGHKTDSNDALAVAETANRPNIKVAPCKGIEQQGMQSVQRSRELLVQERTALSNHLRGFVAGVWGSDTAGFCRTHTTHTRHTGRW